MHARQGKLSALGLLFALSALLLAASCGGVDSGGTGAVSQGPITGFGSIIVNGVRFDESAAAIRDDDGATLGRERLQLGVMTRVDAPLPMRVSGTLRAVATSVRVSSELIGPVSAVDTTAGSLTVLEQTVLVTPATVFDTAFVTGLASVPVGAPVEVYGRYDAANARYTATRIEARPNPSFYKVRAPIATLTPALLTLTIGGLTIDYSSVPSADKPNAFVGRIVRARLHPMTQSATAIAVALRSGVEPLPDDELATIEGRISAITSTRQFSVNGTPVDAGAARFPNGETGVVLGARVKVEGLTLMGVVDARTVTVEGNEDSTNSEYELHGAIDAIDTNAKTFHLLGVTVDYSGVVEFSGGTAADLAVGKRVEVSGTLSSSGSSIKAREIDFSP